MDVVITGKQVEITPSLKRYIEGKAKKVEKYTSKATQVVFTLKVEKHRHIVEVLAKINGVVLQAEDEAEAMYAAVDTVMEKLGGQLKRSKEKLKSHRVKQALVPSNHAKALPVRPTVDVSKIKKIKNISVVSMTVEEAVLQIEQLGTGFFLFGNLQNHQLNVLYRRKDGSLGLIETVLAS